MFGTVALELVHFSSVSGSCVAPQSHGLKWEGGGILEIQTIAGGGDTANII